MKGVVLAGGRAQRLRALTHGANKHLLPIGGRPMIDHPISTLIDAGITDILVVTAGAHADAMRDYLRATPLAQRAALSLAEQANPAGIADALACAESFAAGGPLCVILGDNLLERSILPIADRFRADPTGAAILLTETDEPERFAVTRFRGDDPAGALTDIIEKPTNPPSRMCVIGVYFYDNQVFDICHDLRPSGRGELEITGVNREYLRRGSLRHELLEGWWIDAGTPESLEQAHRLLTGADRRP